MVIRRRILRCLLDDRGAVAILTNVGSGLAMRTRTGWRGAPNRRAGWARQSRWTTLLAVKRSGIAPKYERRLEELSAIETVHHRRRCTRRAELQLRPWRLRLVHVAGAAGGGVGPVGAGARPTVVFEIWPSAWERFGVVSLVCESLLRCERRASARAPSASVCERRARAGPENQHDCRPRLLPTAACARAKRRCTCSAIQPGERAHVDRSNPRERRGRGQPGPRRRPSAG